MARLETLIGAPAVAAAAALLPLPAFAQIATPMQPGQPKPSSQAVARRAAAEYGKCLVRDWGRAYRPLVEEPFGDSDSFARFDKLKKTACMDRGMVSMKFTAMLVRGVVYEALYAEDFGKSAPIASFEGVAPVAFPYADAPGSALLDQYRASMELGECVARRAPLESRAFILSKVASAEENAAIAALMPALGGCVDSGTQMELSRSIARAAIAEPLYRLTRAKGAN